MPITVTCQNCGKSLRAKDELAGKAVRCPGCQQPLRIPAGAGVSAPAAASKPAAAAGSASGGAVEAAIAKVEAARKKREALSTENTTQKSEVSKLVEEFDKVAPKAKEKEAAAAKKPPGTPEAKIGEKPKTVTAIDKAADRVGMLKGTLVWKYVVIAVLLGGGGYGSTVLIQKIMSSSHEATTVKQVDWDAIDKIYAEAEKAANAGNWSRVRDCLEEVVRNQHVRPYKNNLRYKALKEKLDRAVGGG